MRRANNQDSFAAVRAKTAEAWRRRGHLFMVADGMGAHAVGELASKLACDNIPHNYRKQKAATPSDAIIQAYGEVAQLIHTKASANQDFQGMGTTASTMVLLPDGVLIAHVGDSRVYRVRDDRIEQLTFDHSLVWELVRRNHLKPEEAQKAVPRNVITRSLGPDPTIEVDLEGPLPVREGDAYVICSDGLSGPVANAEIGAFAAHFHPEVASNYLMQLANLRGGHDNITVLIVRIGPWEDPDDPKHSVQSNGLGQASSEKANPKALISGLLNAFQRKPQPEEIVEHVYQSASCKITEPLLNRLAETINQGCTIATDNRWPVNWSNFNDCRTRAHAAREAKDSRQAIRWFGEAINLLASSGRGMGQTSDNPEDELTS